MAFKTDQIKLKEDYAIDDDAGTPADGTVALIGNTGSKELKIRDGGAWVAISGGGGGAVSNLQDLGDVASSPSVQDTVGVVNGDGHLTFAKLSVDNIDSSNLNTSAQWDNDDTTLATTAAIQDWVEGQSYLSSETFTELSQDPSPELSADLIVGTNRIKFDSNPDTNELSLVTSWNGDPNHVHLQSVKSIELYLDSNQGNNGTEAIRVYNDINPNENTPDDTNWIWKLHENGSMYMTNDIDMGTNVITDAKVANWDTAVTWGDHSSEGYISQQSDIMSSLGEDYTVPDNVGHNIIAITGDPSGYDFIFTKASTGNWNQTGQQKIEIINASVYTQTLGDAGGAEQALFYIINTAQDAQLSVTIDPFQKATIIPNMSDNSGRHFVLLSSI